MPGYNIMGIPPKNYYSVPTLLLSWKSLITPHFGREKVHNNERMKEQQHLRDTLAGGLRVIHPTASRPVLYRTSSTSRESTDRDEDISTTSPHSSSMLTSLAPQAFSRLRTCGWHFHGT